MTENKATLTLPGGKSCEFPIIKATIGEDAMDVSALYKQTGMFTYDPGFLSTASCKSSITYIDGEAGILLHRGYTIADLAEKSDFTSVAYALLFGDLPSKVEKKEFSRKLVSNMYLDEEVKKTILGFTRESHPMAIMMAAISVLSAKYGANYEPYKEESINECSIQLIAKTASIGAFVYRYITNLEELSGQANQNKTFEENLIEIMFEGTGIFSYREILHTAINKLLILHADHEQNASTSAVRLVASTDVNIYAACVAGFAALWGPLHGGANEAVVNMLHGIGKRENIASAVEKAKDKNNPFRLMGFGHRVYKNYDPRAKVLKSSCDEILKAIGASNKNSEILEIAKQLEEIALSDKYFAERKLFPNVDFYSGIIYEALGMKSSFFTVVFGMARTAGWVSQVKESMLDSAKKISRPRQVYTGNINKKL
jgi:citrate synthase